MSTIIQLQTLMCPLGIGNPNGVCRFHRSSDNLPADNLCPIHKLVLVQTTDPLDKITVTILDPAVVDTFVLVNNQPTPQATVDALNIAITANAAKTATIPVLITPTIMPQVDKDVLKGKIAQDIIKFTALQSKT